MFMNSPDMLSHENFVGMPLPADGTLTLLVGNMIRHDVNITNIIKAYIDVIQDEEDLQDDD